MTVVFSMYKFNLDIVLNARQILTGEQRCESVSALMKWVPFAASKDLTLSHLCSPVRICRAFNAMSRLNLYIEKTTVILD